MLGFDTLEKIWFVPEGSCVGVASCFEVGQGLEEHAARKLH